MVKRLYWQLNKEGKLYTTEQIERKLTKIMYRNRQDVIHYEFRIVGIDEQGLQPHEQRATVDMDSFVGEGYDVNEK